MLYEFLSFCCVLALTTLVQLALADSSMDSIKYGLRAIVNLAARNDANQAQLEVLGVYKGLFVILDLCRSVAEICYHLLTVFYSSDRCRCCIQFLLVCCRDFI